MATHRIHHLPGRLRIWLPEVRRNHALSHQALRKVRTISGVNAAQASVITGSLLISYSPCTTSRQHIVTTLKAAGFHLAFTPPAWHGETNLAESSAPNDPADNISDIVIKNLLDRSATALFAAPL